MYDALISQPPYEPPAPPAKPTTKAELRKALQRCVDAMHPMCSMYVWVAAVDAEREARAILARPARVVGYVTYYSDGVLHSTWKPVPDAGPSLEWCLSAARRNAKAIGSGVVRKLVIR